MSTNVNPQQQQPVPNANQPQAQAPYKFGFVKMIAMYWLINFIIGQFFGKKGTTNPSLFKNSFENNEPFEFRVYISNLSFPLFDDWKNSDPAWIESGLSYNYDPSNYREKTITLESENLIALTKQNRTLYAHVYLRSLRSPYSANYSEISHLLYLNSSIKLIEYKKKRNTIIQENLVFGSENPEKDQKPPQQQQEIEEKSSKDTNITIPHLKPKIWIQLIHDETAYHPQQIPPQIPIWLDYQTRMYPPILDTSNWWFREKEYIPIEENNMANQTLEVKFMFNTYWFYKYMMERQMTQATSMYEDFGIDSNLDDIKEMFMDNNPYFLGITMIVSLLHSIFEFLALKNDIQFWRNVQSHKGLSLRALYINLYVEIIVLLYLLDNETSTLILISSFAELGVTIWKIFKTTKFKIRPDGKFPFIELDHKDTYKNTTESHDQKATKYLLWIAMPLYFGYIIYSLLYEQHKGWYSFLLQTQVGFIYVFGFIQMTPQLYINYKLKSVEHLPWRTLVYKFLNTIIDDLFAFIITMPWMKRLSCFRDDVIFLIYLYQRWIYRVDKRRDVRGNIVVDSNEKPNESPNTNNNQSSKSIEQKEKKE